MSKRAKPLRLNALSAALLTRAMMDGPSNISEMCEACGLYRKTVQEYIRALRKVKAVHVADWEQDRLGRFVVPSFALGEGKDKPRPPRRVGTVAHRRQRAERVAQQALIRRTAGAVLEAA